MRVFPIFCTYISERVFITVLDKPERGFKRYVRYRKTGRTRQAAGAGKHPPETAARGNKPLRFLPDVIHGTCRGGGLAYTWQRTWLKIAGTCGLLGAAITLHAIYNLLIAYGGAAQYIAYALPVLLVAAGRLSAFRLSRRK